jgi:FkbM family methyltransferase
MKLNMRKILLGIKFLILNIFDRNIDPIVIYLEKEGYKFDFAIDIGAASGDWGYALASKLKVPKIWCFEPSDEFFIPTLIGIFPYFLRRQINLKKVAVTDTSDKYFLIFEEGGKRLRYRSFISTEILEGQEGKRIETTSLRTFSAKVRGYGLLKIDVEGGELNVLKSGDADFFNKISCIVFEFNTSEDAQMFTSIERILEDFGFTIYTVQGQHITRIETSNLSIRSGVNLMALKNV